jgi:hypothetical protein
VSIASSAIIVLILMLTEFLLLLCFPLPPSRLSFPVRLCPASATANDQRSCERACEKKSPGDRWRKGRHVLSFSNEPTRARMTIGMRDEDEEEEEDEDGMRHIDVSRRTTRHDVGKLGHSTKQTLPPDCILSPGVVLHHHVTRRE